jgi:hypothetical protein
MEPIQEIAGGVSVSTIFDLADYFSHHIVPQAGDDVQKVEIHGTLKPSVVVQLYTHKILFIALRICDRRGNEFKNKPRIKVKVGRCQVHWPERSMRTTEQSAN